MTDSSNIVKTEKKLEKLKVSDNGEENLNENEVVWDLSLMPEGKDQYPTAEKLIYRKDSNIVTFMSQFRQELRDPSQILNDSGLVRDIEFLRHFKHPELCAYGACDCEIMKFICSPVDGPHRILPTGEVILKDLKAIMYKHDDNPNLAKTNLPYLGYKDDLNDEVHTDSSKQHIFQTEEDELEEKEDDATMEESSSQGKRVSGVTAHRVLKEYVLNSHLYYVLLHTQRFTEVIPEQEVGLPEEFTVTLCNMVLLFAVGVSPHSGNLIGVVTLQACHNLCD